MFVFLLFFFASEMCNKRFKLYPTPTSPASQQNVKNKHRCKFVEKKLRARFRIRPTFTCATLVLLNTSQSPLPLQETQWKYCDGQLYFSQKKKKLVIHVEGLWIICSGSSSQVSIVNH